MDYTPLGRTGLKVSKLCFGSLTLGPLQRNLPIEAGSALIAYAAGEGVNFVDTADLYGTYPYIRPVLKDFPDLIVATKSYAYDRTTAAETLERALSGLDRDYVDLFLLHEQEGPLTLKGHWGALMYYTEQKQKGRIRAVGLSTHTVAAVRAALKTPEIDCIHPILNAEGFGIADGTRADMEDALCQAHQQGIGIYTMKPLGGGHLIRNRRQAFSYLLAFPYLHSIAVGMQRREEIDYNIRVFEHRTPEPQTEEALSAFDREIIVQDWCSRCGRCIARCAQGALSQEEDGRIRTHRHQCLFCGYCGAACPEFAIKVL